MDIFLTVLLFIFAFLILFWQSSNLISVLYGSPYVSARKILVRKALELAQIKKGEIFFELGSGTGQVLIEAQKLGAASFGFEISPAYYLWSKIRTIFIKNITIKHANIFNIDLTNADIIYVYLLPPLLEKLVSKFRKDLKKGARIVSIGFEIVGLQFTKKIVLNNSSIYLYRELTL